MSTLSSIAPIRLRFRLAEARADQGEIQGWKDARQAGGDGLSPDAIVADAQAMVKQFLRYHKRDRRIREGVLRLLAQNKLANVHLLGEKLVEIFEHAVALHEAVKECVRLASVFGEIRSLDLFEQAGQDYRQWAESLRKDWPWVDHARLKRSHASYESGQLRSTKDLLDELCDSAHP